ncbi:uncharacterized protein LOC107045987 [Diachasma alloeum]|uniref:uncharacterized protein LOC107045987 n=1 Tax=Diachasma alloeum TaxID=454923 RepID=UPI0007381893|nr:uncharacterized protein LOC107045987 [Diachasma alloeum]
MAETRQNQPTLTLKALLEKAHDFWIRQVQADAFAKQLELLKKEQPLSQKDELLRLHPAVDPKGIIRVNGRIAKAAILYDEKHPIILPAGRITDLIIDDTHRRTLHGGLQITLSTLRQRYWVINARRLVKSHIHKCVKCIRFDGKPAHQIMAALPPPRVTPSPPFTHTGMDQWASELSDYSTKKFLAASDRFTSCRGLPFDLYSDNGTNFQGAERELREKMDQLEQNEELRSTIATRKIAWRSIPPSSPHFGGLWEVGVKSVKTLLKRLLDERTPRFEE